jgi:hypothetical protein
MSDNKLLTEEIDLLFEGISVSKEQKEKFQTTLEALIGEKSKELKVQLHEENIIVVENLVNEKVEDLTNTLSDYLDYVIKEWIEENKLEVESGLKVEAANEFMQSLKSLMEQANFEVPHKDQDLLAISESKVAKLEQDLNEEMLRVVEMKKEIDTYKKNSVIKNISEGLTETQKEKFNSLIEDINFLSDDVYSKKLKTIKETFFNSNSSLNGESDEDTKKKQDKISNRMSAYLNAL